MQIPHDKIRLCGICLASFVNLNVVQDQFPSFFFGLAFCILNKSDEHKGVVPPNAMKIKMILTIEWNFSLYYGTLIKRHDIVASNWTGCH